MNRELYVLLMNGEYYGVGHLQYINELIYDYTETMKMYGKEKVDFSILKHYNGVVQDYYKKKGSRFYSDDISEVENGRFVGNE